MIRIIILSILAAGICLPQKTTFPVHGKVVDTITGLPIPGCTVYLKSAKRGTLTDSTGRFTFYLQTGQYTLAFSHISYVAANRVIIVPPGQTPPSIEIKLIPAVLQQKEVSVTVKRTDFSNIQEMQARDLSSVPTVFNDVLRSVTVLSGVVTNNELSSGYSVRGGNFSENLLYLNGYEIYRPFLLRQGVEENQTFINPDMVEKLAFFNGSFPVTYGDKMSSALSVDYRKQQPEALSGKLRSSLLNGSVTLGQRIGKLTVLGGGRYAYPGLFINKLQTSGGYHPFFADFQLFSTYSLHDGEELELLVVNGKNTFNTTPVNWTGNFRDDHGPGLASSVDLRYDGHREYQYKTALYALRYKKNMGENSSLVASYAYYGSNEDESGNVFSKYFYIPDAAKPDDDVQYLKSRQESSDNHLRLVQHSIDVTWLSEFGLHKISTGLSAKLKSVHDMVNESANDTGSSNLIDLPVSRKEERTFYPDEFCLFALDSYKPAANWEINAGLRFSYAKISRELLVSPRLQATWNIDINNKLFAGWGYYYQLPYYLEGRLNPITLHAQKAIHYSLGWENKYRPNITLRMEGYYKSLNNLIPYYTEGQKIIYSGSNSRQGYAYGLDAMFQGEIVKGIQSWLGYGYLSTQDRPKSGGTYQRRLTDQTHSLLFFLQDRIKKRRNWQVHTRFQIGTGQLYFNKNIEYDEQAKKYYMSVDMQSPSEYFIYMRADMGCSSEFTLRNKNKLRVTAEVLNVFDTYNYAGYQFVQVFVNIPRPVRVPEVLSSRFFNLQVEYEF